MNNFQESLKRNPLKTKREVESALISLTDPVYQLMHAQQTPGRVRLSDSGSVYNTQRREIEGFLRTLWGLGPLFSHSKKITEYHRYFIQANEGILVGTNPEHSLYWGTLSDYDQLFVEMGALATYLSFTKNNFWDTLNQKEQHQIYQWLNQINQHTIPNTNWLFFRILVNTFFDSVHLLEDEKQLLKDLNEIEKYYLADGWYFDGYENQIDYYIPFGMQYYGLLYAHLTKRKHCDYAEKYRHRGSIFAQTFKNWFAKDGVALPFGRSLAYRFAQSSFFAMAAVTDISFDNFSLGEAKYLLLQNMRHWFQQPIFTAEGLLSIGYYYPNLVMAEGYNSPGSPYWAFKNFCILSLDDSHPFWTIDEEVPTFTNQEKNSYSRMLLVHSDNQKELQAFTAGQHSHEHAHGDAKYEKFVYSTTFGFSVPKGNVLTKQGAFDNTLAVSEGNTHYRTAFGYQDYRIHDTYVYSLWQPWENVTIKTFIIPCYPWHIRLHLIDNKRKINLLAGSFSAPDDGYLQDVSPSAAYYQSSKGRIGIKTFEHTLDCSITFPEPNTNLLYPKTALAQGTATLVPGLHTLLLACLGDAFSNEVAKEIEATLSGNILSYSYDGKKYQVTLEEL